jgi:lipoprotein-anchoring transpeptidase ErfK/SrfK
MARALCVLASLAVLAAAAFGVGAPAAAVGKKPAVKPVQELAALRTTHKVVSRGRGGPLRGGKIHAREPITGGQTVLPVIGHATTKQGADWLQVMLPGRPNGRTGWIAKRGTIAEATSWHVVVKTSTRQVLVYNKGRVVQTFGAIVGKPSTPTPHGRFYVEESIRMRADAAGAPFALALSARSNVLQEFEGGPGQIALHGVGNIGGEIGTAVSHGCVRLANPDVSWLAAHLGPGVPVTITN